MPQRPFMSHWCKGEVLLGSASTQGWGLMMLALDARANPHYAWLWPKSESSLSLPMMQGWSLTTLTFDPRERPCNAHPRSKSESELSSPLLQGQSLAALAFDPRGKPLLHSVSLQSLHHSFVLYHTTNSIYLHLISFIYIYLFEQKFSQFNYTYPKTLTQSGLTSTSLHTIFIVSLLSGRSTSLCYNLSL